MTPDAAPMSDFDLIRRALDLMPWSGEGRRDAKASALEALARLEAEAEDDYLNLLEADRG